MRMVLMFVADKVFCFFWGGVLKKIFITDKMKTIYSQWQTRVSLTQINDNKFIKGNHEVRTFKLFFPFLSGNKHVAN